MLRIKTYECESCKNEFLIIDDYSLHCIKCGSKNIKVTSENNNTYELYNVKMGYTVG